MNVFQIKSFSFFKMEKPSLELFLKVIFIIPWVLDSKFIAYSRICRWAILPSRKFIALDLSDNLTRGGGVLFYR